MKAMKTRLEHGSATKQRTPKTKSRHGEIHKIQEKIDVAKNKLRMDTELIVVKAYLLGLEDQTLLESVEAVVAKYKETQGSDLAVEELIETLENEFKQGVQKIVVDDQGPQVMCGRCRTVLKRHHGNIMDRHFCHCCHRLLPTAALNTPECKNRPSVICKECRPADGLSLDEREALTDTQSTISSLLKAITLVVKACPSIVK
ncbi:hypothetical protein Poli38472_013248 [Pythium oligandrum]|uniref:Uncharacterized protein n=1 Tax=Pythium oligandrum TaxID=41045 RepID=A0A8K1C2Q4_PYTOL|nr:hypothetical protein Poli38472_013248 [Pythium oligandrum]|eukprot:TMW55357.1 hypothetical protein Poli38472_013248 [Pythium oligandrum]